jgi:hypothetical protein
VQHTVTQIQGARAEILKSGEVVGYHHDSQALLTA